MNKTFARNRILRIKNCLEILKAKFWDYNAKLIRYLQSNDYNIQYINIQHIIQEFFQLKSYFRQFFLFSTISISIFLLFCFDFQFVVIWNFKETITCLKATLRSYLHTYVLSFLPQEFPMNGSFIFFFYSQIFSLIELIC